jgi:hypothetical protein
MRLIDADRMKDNTPNWLLEEDSIGRTRHLYGELDYQPTVIEGTIAKSKVQYKKTTKIKPLVIHYSIAPRSVKYVCPVCKAIGNENQLSHGVNNCPLCNVNLIWDDIE